MTLRPHTSRQFESPRSWLTSHVTADSAPPSPSRARSGSSVTALIRSIHEMGLMRRRYGTTEPTDRCCVDLDRMGGGFRPDVRPLVAASQRRNPRGCDDPDRVVMRRKQLGCHLVPRDPTGPVTIGLAR
jgi:hypothetical protein